VSACVVSVESVHVFRSVETIDLEQSEWAECGVLTNVQICIVHSKVTILLLVVDCPNFSNRNYKSIFGLPEKMEATKRRKAKNRCLHRNHDFGSVGFLLSVFNSVEILQLCF